VATLFACPWLRKT